MANERMYVLIWGGGGGEVGSQFLPLNNYLQCYGMFIFEMVEGNDAILIGRERDWHKGKPAG